MDQQQTAANQQHQARQWSKVDELNWAADRATIRGLKLRGEEPSEWLAAEYRELTRRRMGLACG